MNMFAFNQHEKLHTLFRLYSSLKQKSKKINFISTTFQAVFLVHVDRYCMETMLLCTEINWYVYAQKY